MKFATVLPAAVAAGVLSVWGLGGATVKAQTSGSGDETSITANSSLEGHMSDDGSFDLDGGVLAQGYVPPPQADNDDHDSGGSGGTSSTAPTISTQPAGSTSVAVGSAINLSVTASGSGTLTYQWFRNNRVIWGANSASLSIASAALTDAGVYRVLVRGGGGLTLSSPAVVSVASASAFTTVPAGITLTISPTSAGTASTGTVNAGANVTFAVASAGTGLTYQWQFNDHNISGATSSSLTINTVGATASGAFSLVISNSSGVVADEVTELNVVVNAHLVNLSFFGQVASGQNATVGFVVKGTGTKPLLIRGVGPTLAASFGITGAITQPKLTLYGRDEQVLDSNSGWADNAAIATAATQVGAFPLVSGSADAALLESLPSGLYTAQVSSASGTGGTALVELYDTDAAATPTAALVNVSGRGYVTGTLDVGSGTTKPIIAGLSIAGSTSETVLIRGVGPGLRGYGVDDAVADTVLTLYDSQGNVVTTNAGWRDDLAISAAGNLVSAFSLQADSADSALLVTLAPGIYTAQVTSKSGGSGEALIEVYEVK
jgi:hypothetical protein